MAYDINNFSAHSGELVRADGTGVNMADVLGSTVGQGVIDEIDNTALHTPSGDASNWKIIEVLESTVFETLTQEDYYVNGVAAPDAAIQQGTIAAVGTLTVDTNPTASDTMTIGSTEYTFVAEEDFDTAGEIPIGEDVAETQANIVAAINGTDEVNTAHTLVSAGAFASDDCLITAKLKGTAGNSIATTETFTAGTNVFGATTLEDGASGTVASGTVLYGKFTSLRLVSGSVKAYA